MTSIGRGGPGWSCIAALLLASCGGAASRNEAPVGAPRLVVAADEGSGASRADVPAEANPHGKYRRLLTVVRAPEDEATYGEVKDYGLWGPGEWAGAMRPRGYWVYVAPSWYVWESQAGNERAQGDPTSANGKYVDLVKTLDVPQDRYTYGDFKDFGKWGPGEWAGAMQPEGYWVYVAPTWYIWCAER